MIATLPREKMTVAEFLDWCDAQGGDDRFELIDGVVVAMVRDRASHNLAKLRAVDALAAAIRAAAVDCVAFVDGIGVSYGRFNHRIPDAVVHGGKVDLDASMVGNPVVVVEVVSPSSEERDVHAKLHDYFSIGSVQHYLIVYDDRRLVVHHRRSGVGPLETTFISDGEIELVPPGIRLGVDQLFGEVDR